MKDKFQSKSVPRGTRTIWRYLGALFLLFTFAIGNVWAAADVEVLKMTESDFSTYFKAYTDVTLANTCGSSNVTVSGTKYYAPKVDKTDNSTWITVKSNGAKIIDKIELLASANNTDKNDLIVGWAGWNTVSASNGVGASDRWPDAAGSPTSTGKSNTTSIVDTIKIVFDFSESSYKEVRITKRWNAIKLYGGSSSANYPASGAQTIRVYGFRVWMRSASGPVDPVFTYTPATYTIGDPAIDLSTKVTSTNTTGAITFAVSTADAGTTGASIANSKNFTASAAGTAKITVSQAASTGYNAKTQDIDVTVVAPAPAACPAGLTISGTAAYTEGETISLTAALSEGNGEITYNWYKGADLATAKAAGSIGTGTSFSKASCTTGDAGNYFCVATKATCSDAESAAYAVTVAAAIDPWIIKVALSGSAGATRTMSGSIGGTADASGLGSSSPYKIGGDAAYVSLTLSTGYFYPGDSVVLDLSKTGQIFYGATDNDNDHLLGTTTAKDGIHYFILPASFPANTNTIHVGRTGSTYNGTLSYMAVYRTPICPQTLTISGEKDYVPGDKIELTASLTKGNGAITYQWYKGGTANENKLTGKTNAKLEIEDCVAGDAGDYYCIASKEDCSDAVNAAAYTITVNDFVAVTGITINPASPTVAAKSKITLTAEVAPVEATNKVVEWSVKSGSEAYASVNATTGEVTGKAEGNAVIVATATDGSGVFAEKTVVVTPFVCPTKGEIASVVYDLAKKPGSDQTIPGNSRINMTTYATVTNAVAYFGNTGGSGNAKVTTSKFKLGGSQAYAKLELDCALKEGDTIRLDNSTTIKLSLDTAKTSAITVSLASGKHDYIVPAEGDNLSTIFVWQNGSNVEFSYIKVIRPAKYDVTFNMHGHGTQVEPQNILEGGKVEEPATTDITGWDFGGWFKTYVAEPESYSDAWDFENDVVTGDVELHAKWTKHVASSDATLASLKADGIAATVDPLDATKYTVELPMGTSAAPAIVATPTDSKATATVMSNSLAAGAKIEVVPESGEGDKKTYTLSYTIADSKDIVIVYKTNESTCAGDASAVAKVAAFAQYLELKAGTESNNSSLNTTATNGAKITIAAKPGYAFKAMSFYGKVQDGSCEISLDGAAATTVELDPQNNNDACYVDVFSNAEVREFSIINTGTNGVWIRNMQLTIVEACAPVALTWDAEPVEFEVGKAEQTIAATANSGGAVSYSTLDNTVIDVNASTGALTVSGLGSVTLKATAAAGDGETYCDEAGEISKQVKTYYLVKFDAQNEDVASNSEVKYYSGDAAIALPASEPSYAGHTFQGWFDAASGGNAVTSAVTPSASRTIYAQWLADCAGPSITTEPVGASYFTGRTATALNCEATAGNEGALTYTWYSCDDALRTNPVALAGAPTPSTAVAGTFYYFCAVTEEGCAVVANSAVAEIVVADKDGICIIKSTPTSGTEADVDGVYQGNAYFNGRDNDKKLNSQYHYVGVELADGYTFQAGDKVVLNQAATVNGTTDITKFYVFAEVPAEGKSYVTVENASPVQGDNWFAMPAELVGKSSLYIGRVDSKCNPTVGYLAVYRGIAPILNKVTVAGVEGKPNASNKVAVEVPFSTTQTQLEAIAFDWVSNNDAWTDSHNPSAANEWEFGVENTVTFTDKDGDASVYYVTVSKAVASSDATLSALSYGDPAKSIALADGVFEYNVTLPYGTSAVPVLAATKNHAGATIKAIANAAAFVDRKATSTVTVKAEDNTEQVYTVHFTVDRYATTALWDGSTMDELSDITAMDVATADISVEGKNASFDGKNYTKALSFGGNTKNTRYFGIVVPEGKVAKVSIVYRSRGNSARSIIIGTAIASAIDESAIVYATKENDTELLYKLTADIFAAGTIYINTTNGFQVFEIDVQLADGYARSEMLGAGVLGTVCVPNNVAVEDIQGVTVYELMGREPQYGKLAFDEIESGELEAGVPYLFQAHGNHMAMLYGEDHVDNPVDKGNGMYGTFGKIVLSGDQLDGVYYFAQKALWSCEGAVDLTIAANRAYVKLGEIDYLTPNQQNPAPGRRRILMGVNGEKVATGIGNVQGDEVQSSKVLINGQLFILRGEKMYDATGRLVK